MWGRIIALIGVAMLAAGIVCALLHAGLKDADPAITYLILPGGAAMVAGGIIDHIEKVIAAKLRK